MFLAFKKFVSCFLWPFFTHLRIRKLVAKDKNKISQPGRIIIGNMLIFSLKLGRIDVWILSFPTHKLKRSFHSYGSSLISLIIFCCLYYRNLICLLFNLGVYIYTYIHVYIYTIYCIYTHMYISIYMYIYIHTIYIL